MPRRGGHRGQTVLPVKWNSVRTERGHRYIEGIAYNAAIKGQRKRVTCSDKTWNHPDDDVFYWDEAVRWTVDELSKMDMTGVPMRIMHADDEDLPIVGNILHNFLDDGGNLHIVAEIPGDDLYGQAAISLVDNGTCSDLSIGYNIQRNPDTKVVTHGPVDEVSFVDRGHFRGCRVGIRANKKGVKLTEAPYTLYRMVRAMQKTSGPTEMAETAPPTKSLAEQLDADLPAGATPEDLLKNMAIIKKKLIAAEAEKKALQEKVDSVEDADKKRRTEYAQKHAERAVAITEHMKEIAKLNGVDNLSKEWEELNTMILTDPDQVSQEVQAVQVSCSRGFRQMQKELAESKARIAQLEQAGQEAAAMAAIDAGGEQERLERRDIKARSRNGGIMTADPAAAPAVRNVPGWAQQFMQNSVGHVAPRDRVENRTVQARMSLPAEPVVAPVQQQPPVQHIPQQQQKVVQQPVYQPPQQQRPAWYERTKNSMSQNPQNSEMFKFLHEVAQTTDFTKQALAPSAGLDTRPRQAGSY